MSKFKPGNGWIKLSESVYEREGVRIHTSGVVRTQSGNFYDMYSLPPIQVDDLIKTIAINGGNRRRGLMAWANKVGFDSE